MIKPHGDLPTFKDLCPGNPPCLDSEYAAKNFLGKTLQEAEALFHENCIHYGEDLAWMGRVGFEYYLQAFQNYLVSEASRGDYTVGSVVVAFQCRHEQGEIGAAKSLVLECLDYLIANFEKFDLEDTVQPTLKDIFSDIAGDQESRPQVEAVWADVGGNADEMEEIWQSMDSFAINNDIVEDQPGLITSVRWKALRKSIAED